MTEIKTWLLNNLGDIIFVGTVLLAAFLLTRITKFVIKRYLEKKCKGS